MRTVANNIKSIISQTESVKKYLKFVEERFRYVDKSLAGTLMVELTAMKFDRSRSIQNHTEMINIASRPRTLRMKVDDTFLVQSILNHCLLSIDHSKLAITLLRISGMLVNCPICLLKRSQDLRRKEVIPLTS